MHIESILKIKLHIKAEIFWEIFKNLHQVLAFLEPFQNQNQPFFIQLLQPTHFSEYFWCQLKPKIKFQSNLIRSEPEVKNLIFFWQFSATFSVDLECWRTFSSFIFSNLYILQKTMHRFERLLLACYSNFSSDLSSRRQSMKTHFEPKF